MSVSHHSPEYREMQQDFFDVLGDNPHLDEDDIKVIINDLFSIMNDYGAVSWT